MANGTRNRPGGCGCRQALNNGVTYTNMNYAASESSSWPFFNGPCPGTRPVNGCPGFCRGTNGLPCGCLSGCGCGGGSDETASSEAWGMSALTPHGFFIHSGPLSLAQGEGVPFSWPGSTQQSAQIRVLQAGVYLIEYHLTGLIQVVSNARFTLLANGAPVQGGDVRFMADSAGQAHSVSGQVIVRLCAQATLSLVSDASLQIAPNAEGDTVASLALIRLS